MGQDLTKLTPDELKARQIKEMDAEMKQKLQRGANYNMKVVIKGDKNTGKTCLWRRLQRMSFLEDYRSTEQIQIATIAWDYKATSDKIKVEVWDVVDKASKRKESGNLKIGIQGEDGLDVDLSDDDDEERKTPNLPATTPGVNPQGSFAVDKLDAETVNVYKNCHAVLFLMDPRKKWTFDYIERELPNVPKSTFVLILVNYKDVPQNQRVISEYEMQEFARNAGKFVRCLECSMRNCYGMKGIRCFFNLPFLKLKRQYIIQQLKENEADLDAADQELDLVNSEQNYDFYLKWLEENRKNVKATAQMTSVLPDGPPPRAAIGSSKGTEVTAASLTDDPKMNRSRSASVPQNPGAGGPARQPTPAKQLPAPVANTAVRGGVGPGGFGSYSHALPKSTNSQPPTTQTPAASARPTQPPQPTTPQRAPAAAVPPAQAEAAKTAPAEGGGLMSWTSKLFSSAASPAKPAATAPKREVRDVVADLQKLAKDPAARSAQTPSSVEDFVPPTEGGGDDFWGGDDDDDDDDEQKANANGDSDDDDGRSLIAKDEDLEDDDEEEEEVSPAAAKAKAKREREEREKREREREQKERELKEKERQRKERERERAQAEALRRQFEQQEAAAAAAAAAAKPGGDYKQVSDDDDDDDDVTADVDSTPSAAPNGHKPAEKPKKKEKSIWGTKEEDSDDDDDDDDDNEAWGLPPKNKKDGAAAKKKTKSNPFIVTNDEDLPSDDDDDEKPAKPSITSASMGVLPSATTSVSEKERRREEKERERESRRKRRGVNGSYGDLADASKGESSSTPEGERKERKSRHRHRGERGDEATPEGERRERKSRHRHRGEGGETTSGSGERESRRSSRSSKRSHHRSRSASPTPPS